MPKIKPVPKKLKAPPMREAETTRKLKEELKKKYKKKGKKKVLSGAY